MLYQLGFPEAMNWEEDMLRTMALNAVKLYRREEIPEHHQKTFDEIQRYEQSNEFLVWRDTKNIP